MRLWLRALKGTRSLGLTKDGAARRRFLWSKLAFINAVRRGRCDPYEERVTPLAEV